MKKILIAFLFATSFCLTTNAQQDYFTAIGFKGGYPAFGALNVKHFLNTSNAVELTVGGGFNTIYVQGLYEIQKPLPEPAGLDWYFGFGPNIGIGQNVLVSASGLLGLDYTFEEIPLNIAIDTGPILNIVPAVGVNWGGGLAIRYVFRK